MPTAPALLWESDCVKPTHHSSPSARTSLGGDISRGFNQWFKCFAERGPRSSAEPPAPAGSRFGAAPRSQPWARSGRRYEILALTESRCIIGKPSGHERANSHIPGWDGKRFTPGVRSPRLALHQASSLLHRPPRL